MTIRLRRCGNVMERLARGSCVPHVTNGGVSTGGAEAAELQHAEPTPVHKSTPKEPDVIPMEIDRSHHKKGNTGCYTCGQEGHKAWNCPKNPQRFNARELSEREESIIRRVLQEKDERKAAEAEAKEDDEEDKEEEDF